MDKIYKFTKISNSKTERGEQWNCHAEIPDVCGKCFCETQTFEASYRTKIDKQSGAGGGSVP